MFLISFAVIMYTVTDTLFTGRLIYRLPRVASTNDHLRALVEGEKNALPEGVVIIADEQFAGRGQHARTWEAVPGQNITASLLLRPVFLDPSRIFYLNKAMALAVHNTVAAYVPDTKIKWPNDIYAGDKKIAGLLIENNLNSKNVQYAIIGIGLNVNQMIFDPAIPNPASLKLLTGENYDLNTVLNALCMHIEKYYLQLRASAFRQIDDAYHQELLWLHAEKDFYAGGEKYSGIIRGVDHDGKLIVEAERMRKVFSNVTFC